MIDFSSARIALDTLFAVPDSKGGLSLPEGRFFVLISGLLDRVSGTPVDSSRPAACADYLNALELEFGSENAGRVLLEECFEAIIKHKILPEQLSSQDETVLFLLNSVLELCAALKETVKFAVEEERRKLLPSAEKLFAELPAFENDLFFNKKSKCSPEVAKTILETLIPEFAALDVMEPAKIGEIIASYAEKNGVKLGQPMWAVRIPGHALPGRCILHR